MSIWTHAAGIIRVDWLRFVDRMNPDQRKELEKICDTCKKREEELWKLSRV